MSKFTVQGVQGFTIDTLFQRLIIFGKEIKVFDAVSILFLEEHSGHTNSILGVLLANEDYLISFDNQKIVSRSRKDFKVEFEMFPRSPITTAVVMGDLVAGYSDIIIEIYIFNY